MLLKRELPFEEVPRLWEACWCAPAALSIAAPADAADAAAAADADHTVLADVVAAAPAPVAAVVAASNDVGDEFVLYCCAAILQKTQKALLKGKSVEDFFHSLRQVQVQCPATELVQAGAALARRELRNRKPPE